MPFSHRLCQVFHCTLFLNAFFQHWVRLRKTGANVPAPVLYSLLISIFISVLLNLNACLPGDPVDLVRQQDQRNPPRRLRWTHQVSRAGIRRLLAFNPSPHSQHFSLNFTNSKKRENYNTFPGFQMDRPVGSFEFNNCQLHQIMSTTTVK